MLTPHTNNPPLDPRRNRPGPVDLELAVVELLADLALDLGDARPLGEHAAHDLDLAVDLLYLAGVCRLRRANVHVGVVLVVGLVDRHAARLALPDLLRRPVVPARRGVGVGCRCRGRAGRLRARAGVRVRRVDFAGDAVPVLAN